MIEILRTVQVNGIQYKPGSLEDAATLHKILTPDQRQRLVDRGVIIGARQSITIEDEPLPNGFPVRLLLNKAGFDTLGKVRSASDEELLELDGVGEGTLDKIREATG